MQFKGRKTVCCVAVELMFVWPHQMGAGYCWLCQPTV